MWELVIKIRKIEIIKEILKQFMTNINENINYRTELAKINNKINNNSNNNKNIIKDQKVQNKNHHIFTIIIFNLITNYIKNVKQGQRN